jgi:NTE family protein
MNHKIKKGLLFCLLLFVLLLDSRIFAEKRPKIGLVLDGGGALGLAHIGILKMMDDHQIPVDYIAGTSMGGIIAALYSMGYSGTEIQELAENMDWGSFFSDTPKRSIQPFFQKRQSGKYQFEFGAEGFVPTPPSGLIFGQKISLFFSSLTIPYEHLNDFDELPIPFRCVAVDLISGKEVILKDGSLSTAMRSTMSIPSVFSPVQREDYLLIDGGLLNNLPVNVAREMGADIVIAVDLNKPLYNKEDLDSAFYILQQSVKIVELNHSTINASQADFVIRPDLKTYTMFDFIYKDKLKGIIQEGDKAAERSWPVLKEMLEKQHILESEYLNTKETSTDNPVIQSILIKGLKTIPYKVITSKLEIEKGKLFEEEELKKKFSEVKQDLRLNSLGYKIIPVSPDEVKLIVTLEETENPKIKQLYITGNTNLSAHFIERLFGLKKDTRFSEKEIRNKILKMYSFGYFTNIQYEIIPLEKNEVGLHLSVKESKQNSYHLGVRYDDRHKIVGVAAFNAKNVLFPGLRSENEFQFMGLTRFHSSLYYPTRSMAMPAYPYFNLEYKDIPTHIFDGMGHVLLNYRNRSVDLGFGAGFLLSNTINSEIGIHQEFMMLKKDASDIEDLYFPELKESLRKICATFTIDTLDDILLPSKGIYLRAEYEASLKKLGSDKEYRLFGLSADIYNTYKDHTLRLNAFIGTSSRSLPLYKFFNKGRPLAFIGMDYDQVFANSIKILRVDYRYNLNNLIHFAFMSNIAFDVEKRFPEKTYSPEILWGTGLGIQLYTPLGTAELTYGLGSKSFEFPKRTQDVLYLTLGTKF